MTLNDRITELTVKYLRDELTADERAELNEWLVDPYNKARFDERVSMENILEKMMVIRAAREEAERVGWQPAIEDHSAKVLPLGEEASPDKRRFGWRIAAAAVVLALAGLTYWKMEVKRPVPAVAPALAREVLLPGRNRATLILADKREVTLDNAGMGNIARQGNTDISKTDSAVLAYRLQSPNHTPNGKSGDLQYNTVITPRGGQYKLQLSDGTTVFLNAQSSLRFPVSFGAAERRVVLEGEGYFMVARDAARVFRVELGTGKEITVLGTRFNVKAYADETTQSATLLEGAIKVGSGGRTAVLAVDDHVSIGQDGSLSVDKDDRADASIAWTRGLFRFRNTPVTEVMLQVSRWYDLDVEYQGQVPNVPITASIGRNTSAWEVLDALKEVAGLKYRVEGKKIIVLP